MCRSDIEGSGGTCNASANRKSIRTADYPTASIRPANVALDCTQVGNVFGFVLRPWQEGLGEVLDQLLSGNLAKSGYMK
ncbi:sugar nucleotide-binding protein [Parvibaculum lavamentivorans]|uniref:sugar nucleotide-binding protein n=1 Tax=Parvibaculum lavamentivorans TaxID=256618 RepID=UPI003CCA9B0D